jgi:hypothetical protein
VPQQDTTISTVQSTSSFGKEFTDLFLQSYADSDPIIHICFLIIVTCFNFSIMITVTLFVHRIWSQFLQNRKNVLKEKYELLLTGIIFDEQDEFFDSKKKKLLAYFRSNYLRSRFNKRVLRKELLALHRSFSGPSEEILKDVYLELKLHKEAMRQLQDTDWSEKADAVRELSQMQIGEAEKKILKLTSHENIVLRLEAQAAMLTLNTENPFGFLATAKIEISEWQQLNLEERAKRLELKRIPNFSQWYSLKNQSVVQFCVRMTAVYNQFESSEALVKLLHSKDDRVVKETVKAIGTMLIDDAISTLVQQYPKSSPEIQDEMIVSAGKIGGDEATLFLASVLNEGSQEMALKAGIALRSIGYQAEDVFAKARLRKDETIDAIINHVMDERI